MMLALWIFTAVAVGLWSLSAWGLYRLLTLETGAFDRLDEVLAQWPPAGVLDAWLPGWQDWLRLGLELTQAALGWVGSVAPWIVWATWATGTGVMLAVAGLLALLIRLATRPASPGPTAA